ncbi:MAG TPA: type II secretion system major pseudopilin GspG [Chthonomonadaceae bacterium]|nr:type II secretion system major pseudopilin GspG [Chthonomonadaceae bacterium]
MHPSASRLYRRGFTLIELLVVIVILGILAAVIVPRFMGRTEDAKIGSAKSQIAIFKTALEMYNADTGSYPADLNALQANPGGVNNWKGPYLKDVQTIPLDPWGNPYVYTHPGQHSPDYDIVSAGPDGQLGTADDITSWSTNSANGQNTGQ